MPQEKNRKFFDLRNGLKAVDFRNKDYFDRIDDKEKSLYSPYMLMRYVSSTSAKDPFFVEHYVEMVNECVNKHCFTLGKHKKLLWLLLCATQDEDRTIKWHEWIGYKFKDSAGKNKTAKFLKEVFTNLKEDEIELLSKINTAKDVKAYAEQMGMSKEVIKKIL